METYTLKGLKASWGISVLSIPVAQMITEVFPVFADDDVALWSTGFIA